MAYRAGRPWGGRVIGFVLVVLLHLVVAYVMVTALARRSVTVAPMLVETQIVAEPPPAPDPIALPKPVEPPPPIQTPPPAPAPPSRPPPAPRHSEIKVEKPPLPSPAPPTAIVAPPPVAMPAPVQPTPVQVMPRLDLQRSLDPEYPIEARQLGEQGSVVLQVLVGVDGSVRETKLVQSSGFDRLDQAALREIKTNYRFIPGTVDGKAQPMWYTIKYNWKLR